MFLVSNLHPVFLGVYIYHLRCYVYQARNLLALDKDSFSGKGKKNLHATHDYIACCFASVFQVNAFCHF